MLTSRDKAVITPEGPPPPPARTCRLLHAHPRACAITVGCGVAAVGAVLTVLLWRDVNTVAVRRAIADADADATTLALAYRGQIDSVVRAINYIASSVAAEAPYFDVAAFREVRPAAASAVFHSLAPTLPRDEGPRRR